MVEHVMTHLVSHDRADLRKRALSEQIIVQGDPGGAEHAGYVRTYARCLTGGVDFEDLLHWNFVGLRHGQNRVADFRVRHWLVSVEERLHGNSPHVTPARSKYDPVPRPP